MKPSALLGALAATATSALALPQTSPDPTSFPQCKSTLSCSFAALAGSTLPQRLDYVREMQAQRFALLNAADQHRAIEGVIKFFIKNNLGAPESWVSYVDAGIVEGIQRGGALALGLEGAEEGASGVPGAREWETFLVGMRDSTLGDRNAHDNAWSIAEQAATDYGVRLADAKFQRSRREQNWFQFSQLFRFIMRNREKMVGVVERVPLVGDKGVEFVDYLTNITDDEPSECFSEVAWFFAGQFDGDLDSLGEILTIVPKLFKCFTA